MGVFKFVACRRCHDRPVYQATFRDDTFLAHTGKGWFVQKEANLGQMCGPLYALDDGGAATPDAIDGSVGWEMRDANGENGGGRELGAGGTPVEVRCEALAPVQLPPAAALSVQPWDGLSSHIGADASAFGHYHLLRGVRVRGRGVWRHSRRPEYHIAFGGSAWWLL